jgi:hypothetical protein
MHSGFNKIHRPFATKRFRNLLVAAVNGQPEPTVTERAARQVKAARLIQATWRAADGRRQRAARVIQQSFRQLRSQRADPTCGWWPVW